MPHPSVFEGWGFVPFHHIYVIANIFPENLAMRSLADIYAVRAASDDSEMLLGILNL